MGERRTGWPSRLLSRVLSWTVISLERELPPASSDLPGSGAGHTIAPCAVLHPTELARFTRVAAVRHCGAGPRLAADGCYPPSCPVVPGLSSAASAAATIWPARPPLILRPPEELRRRIARLARERAAGLGRVELGERSGADPGDAGEPHDVGE